MTESRYGARRLNPLEVQEQQVMASRRSFAGVMLPRPAPLRVLVFSLAKEFVHPSAPKVVATLKELARVHNWNVTDTEDPTFFRMPYLQDTFDVVVFSQTSGAVLNEAQLEALRQFLEDENTPRGWVGLHAAADTFHGNEWYRELLGAHFIGHPPIQKAKVTFMSAAFAELDMTVPSVWEYEDEWYNFSHNVATDPSFRVVATVDEGSYNHDKYEKPQWYGTRMQNPHPLAWMHEVGPANSRSFYCGMGHSADLYDLKPLRQLIGGGINWAGFRDNMTEIDPAMSAAAAAEMGGLTTSLVAADGTISSHPVAVSYPLPLGTSINTRRVTMPATDVPEPQPRQVGATPGPSGSLLTQSQVIARRLSVSAPAVEADGVSAPVLARAPSKGKKVTIVTPEEEKDEFKPLPVRPMRAPTQGRDRAFSSAMSPLVELEMVTTKNNYCKVLVQHKCLSTPAFYAKLIPEEKKNALHFLIADANVDKFWGNVVEQGFTQAGYKIFRIVVAAGEGSKDMDHFRQLVNDIVRGGVERHSNLISLGGGMINNLVGMAAATIHRGLRLIHVCTSLLSQIDAALDIKQAINISCGKNLIGAIYSPSFIVIDPLTLDTLPEVELINGMGEVVKHGLAQDRDFLNWLNLYTHSDLRKPSVMAEAIEKTARLKLVLVNSGRVTEHDEMIPQYGHSIAHALEQASDYKVRHGEAVSVGMCLTAEVGLLLGWCKPKCVKEHYDLCSRYGLPTLFPEYVQWDRFEGYIKKDRYVQKGVPYFMVLQDIAVPHYENNRCCLPIPLAAIKQAIQINQKKCKGEVSLSSLNPGSEGSHHDDEPHVADKKTAAAAKASATPTSDPKRNVKGGGHFLFRLALVPLLLLLLVNWAVPAWFSDITYRSARNFALYKPGEAWINWPQSVHCLASQFLQPTSEAEIVKVMKGAYAKNEHVHGVGSGHSYSHIQCTDHGILMNLDKYNQLLKVDCKAGLATFQAGARLREVITELEKHNMALGILPAIAEQSIAGAISTSTHGGSGHYGSLSALVQSLSMVLANGTVVSLSASQYTDPVKSPASPSKQDNQYFRAAIFSVGSMGIISTVTLKIEPKFYLTRTAHPHLPMNEFFKSVKHWVMDYDYTAFFWIPYTGRIQPVTMQKHVADFSRVPKCTQSLTLAPPPAGVNLSQPSTFDQTWGKIKQNFIWSGFKFEFIVPSVAPLLHPFLGWLGMGEGSHTAPSQDILLLSLPQHYSTDSEFFVSIDKVGEAYAKMVQVMEEQHIVQNAFYIFRALRGDGSLLSYCGDESKVCVAISFYLLFQHETNHEILRILDDALAPYNMRPHLAKHYHNSVASLASRYPHWGTFSAVRHEFDPKGLMLTPFTRELFETPASTAGGK